MKDFGELSRLNLLELLPALLQFLERFDNGLSHAAVSFLRATDDCELFTGGDSLVTVFVVETNSE